MSHPPSPPPPASSPAPPPPPDPGGSAAPIGPPVFASFTKRLGSMIIEALPLAAIIAVGVWAANPGPSQYEDEFSSSFAEFLRILFAGAVILAILSAWFIWSLTLWSKSTTLGKRYTGLRVVDMKTGSPATMGRMMAREVVCKWGILVAGAMVAGGLAGSLLGSEDDFNSNWLLGSSVFVAAWALVSAILIVVTPTHRGVWDRIAGTTVARAD